MRRLHLVWSLLLGLTCSGCDIVVPAGELVTLGNGGQIFGSPGNASMRGRPAVDLPSGGALVIEDADVYGGDDGVAKPNTTGLAGFVARAGGDAVRARFGSVELRAGTLQGGDVTGRGGIGFGGDGVDLLGAVLSVRGGTIHGGGATGVGFRGRAVAARDAAVLVSGGEVDEIELLASTAIISGGTVGELRPPLLFVDTQPPDSSEPRLTTLAGSCIEISGGDVHGPVSLGALSQLIVIGTAFDRPFGEVTTPDPVRVVGTLANGAPISLFAFREGAGSRVVLLDASRPSPGDPRCQPIILE